MTDTHDPAHVADTGRCVGTPRPAVGAARGWYMITAVDVARLLAEHADVRALCDVLEAWADALPVLPPPDAIGQICTHLAIFVDRSERGEAPSLNTLFTRTRAQRLTGVVLDLLDAQQAIDAGAAQDLIAAFDPASPDCGRFPADTLGYMLRCFFENGRHVADFSVLAILALGQQRLTREARAMLIDSLARSRPSTGSMTAPAASLIG